MTDAAKAAHIRWVKASIALAIVVDSRTTITAEEHAMLNHCCDQLTEASLEFGRAMLAMNAELRGPKS